MRPSMVLVLRDIDRRTEILHVQNWRALLSLRRIQRAQSAGSHTYSKTYVVLGQASLPTCCHSFRAHRSGATHAESSSRDVAP